ncbi:hypothetical protein GCK72_002485 [Caenorhabditis remanei]|uniref:Uncharacterized protein n=1 Tax=Caenorhabditis remanei TaxID=31234 RepID=A0A6A5HVD4_CAERE|nr:hypothetical protein GCK72_002485 [Caenorhabditis remanei]KAF1770664.1 hypothetical protein GCK72_002485 [Caenorhabditis remanei]
MSVTVTTFKCEELEPDYQSTMIDYMHETIDSLKKNNKELEDKNQELQNHLHSLSNRNVEEIIEENKMLLEKNKELSEKWKNVLLLRAQQKRYSQLIFKNEHLEKSIEFLNLKSKSDEKFKDECLNKIIGVEEEKKELEKKHQEEVSWLKEEIKIWKSDLSNEEKQKLIAELFGNKGSVV